MAYVVIAYAEHVLWSGRYEVWPPSPAFAAYQAYLWDVMSGAVFVQQHETLPAHTRHHPPQWHCQIKSAEWPLLLDRACHIHHLHRVLLQPLAWCTTHIVSTWAGAFFGARGSHLYAPVFFSFSTTSRTLVATK